MAKSDKVRFWVGILWVDSMVPDWRERLDLVLQIPYAYCIHSNDITPHGELKKPHVHIMVSYGNTTTENNILSMFNDLSLPGAQCCNRVFKVRGVKYMFDYLIHDTAQARKDGKYQYPVSSRVTGLGWDTEAFNQLQQLDKYKVLMELHDDIRAANITTFISLYEYIMATYDLSYFEIFLTYSAHFDRLVKSQYLRNKDDERRN